MSEHYHVTDSKTPWCLECGKFMEPATPMGERELSDAIYSHMYATWSADDMDHDEFEYRHRQVIQLIASAVQAANTRLLDIVDGRIREQVLPKDIKTDYSHGWEDGLRAALGETRAVRGLLKSQAVYRGLICDNCHAEADGSDAACWNCGRTTFVYEPGNAKSQADGEAE